MSMKSHLLAGLVLLVGITNSVNAQYASKHSPLQQGQEKKITDQEKLAKIKGQKVVFLKRGYWIKKHGGDNQVVPTEKYAGRTGVVVQADHPRQLVIALDDTGEKVWVFMDDGLGFFSEMEMAKSWIGKSLWAKGPVQVIDASTGQDAFISNVSHVAVSRIEWNEAKLKLRVYFKSDEGREMSLSPYEGRADFDPALHLDGYYRPLTDYFYLEDPRKRFPSWSKAVWELIEKGQVAIGMSQEMAELACGGGLVAAGAVLGESGNESSIIYTCRGRRYYRGGKKFLVEKGKVVKYVE